MKLLIVDDSKAMRMIVNRTLKQAGFGGHTILEASNGNEALSLIEKEKPDLVLSDWNMPEMKGIDLLRSLRAAGNHTRLGFITSESSSEIRREADEAGAAFVITKPFTAEAFQNSLEAILV